MQEHGTIAAGLGTSVAILKATTTHGESLNFLSWFMSLYPKVSGLAT